MKKMQYVGFLERLVAILIDTSILVAIELFIPKYHSSLETFLYGLLGFAYFVFMHAQYGATVGKMIMKIKVVTEKGGKIDLATSFVREIASYLSGFVLLLGYISVIWDKKKQGWHDKIAKTVVIKA
jgi:uncharacterized RDD family membrane protein YckC